MTSISRRTEAEARRICDRGMAAYISDGVVGGIIPASALLITSAFMPINRLWIGLPLGLGLVSGFGYGVLSSSSKDPESEMEFEIVCDALTPEEEESDGATDQPDVE